MRKKPTSVAPNKSSQSQAQNTMHPKTQFITTIMEVKPNQPKPTYLPKTPTTTT